MFKSLIYVWETRINRYTDIEDIEAGLILTPIAIVVDILTIILHPLAVLIFKILKRKKVID
ncbi:MAG: hypothetical protein IJ629_06130 [Clostridia bacterium]|nr:hypothetical protein [Clostridia bacterium]